MDATQLKRIPIFEDVPDEDLRVITTFASTDEVGEGTVIVREGDFANHFMAIEEGTAEVRKGDEKVGELGPGDIFGEMGLLEKEKRAGVRGRDVPCPSDQDRALGAAADEEDPPRRLRPHRAARRRAARPPRRGLTGSIPRVSAGRRPWSRAHPGQPLRPS